MPDQSARHAVIAAENQWLRDQLTRACEHVQLLLLRLHLAPWVVPLSDAPRPIRRSLRHAPHIPVQRTREPS